MTRMWVCPDCSYMIRTIMADYPGMSFAQAVEMVLGLERMLQDRPVDDAGQIDQIDQMLRVFGSL